MAAPIITPPGHAVGAEVTGLNLRGSLLCSEANPRPGPHGAARGSGSAE